MEALMPRMTLPGLIPGIPGDIEIRAGVFEKHWRQERSNPKNMETGWQYCELNMVADSFFQICKAKCNETHFHHHDMATSRNGLRWERQHNCDQMGPPLLCTQCGSKFEECWKHWKSTIQPGVSKSKKTTKFSRCWRIFRSLHHPQMCTIGIRPTPQNPNEH